MRRSNASHAASAVEDGRLSLEDACDLMGADRAEVRAVLERRSKATQVREATELRRAMRVQRIEAAARDLAALLGDSDPTPGALGELVVMVLRQCAEDYRAFRAQERAQAVREDLGRGHGVGLVAERRLAAVNASRVPLDDGLTADPSQAGSRRKKQGTVGRLPESARALEGAGRRDGAGREAGLGISGLRNRDGARREASEGGRHCAGDRPGSGVGGRAGSRAVSCERASDSQASGFGRRVR